MSMQDDTDAHDGSPLPASARPIILCVEDEDDLRADIVEELTEAGYGVLEARDGEQALEQITAMRPDLILCDINMPGRSGFDVLKDLRDGYPDLAEVPFVFLTAFGETREVIAGKRQGADDYLVKPIEFDLLLATIESRLREVHRIRDGAARDMQVLQGTLDALRSKDDGVVSSGAAEALDLLALGIVLLDPDGTVLFANRSARALGDGEDGLTISARVATDGPGGDPGLARHIREALTGAAAGNDYVASLSLPRLSGRRDLMIVVRALKDGEGAGAPAACVLISDADSARSIPEDVLASIFGLTPTEARVACRLAEGLRLEEIAETLNVSQTTIAFHLRNLYQKTSTNRQADLIALVLAGPMAMVLN